MTKQDISHDSVSLHIAAPADQLYEMVADVTRTPEFSPEILECHWVDGADGPAVGARFRARNKVPNRPSWTNKPVVTGMDPGRSFTFARTEKFAGTVEWSYRFEPGAAGTGTTVTESYTVTRPLTAVGWFVIGTLFGRKDRRTDMRAGMEQTLERMRAIAERDRERA
jgi:Polyketide cyclase / dehydrase and lipid transport